MANATNNENNNKTTSPESKLKTNEIASSGKIIDAKTNFEWKIGNLVEARDRKATQVTYYKSKIIAVRNNNEVKVHFLGWNSRYDQWYDIFSGDLKPCDEELNKVVDKVIEVDVKEFEIGARVMAKWKMDENYYPATVKRLVEKDKKKYYEIVFYDGVKRLIQRSEVKELTEEVANLFPDLVLPNTLSTNESDRVQQEKREEESRRAEAELLLAIQQPQLIVSSDNESLIDVQQKNKTTKENTFLVVESCDEKTEKITKDKLEINTEIVQVELTTTEIENDKIISKIDSKNEEKLVETEKEIHIPLETSEKLIEGKLKQKGMLMLFITASARLSVDGFNPLLSFSALIGINER